MPRRLHPQISLKYFCYPSWRRILWLPICLCQAPMNDRGAACASAEHEPEHVDSAAPPSKLRKMEAIISTAALPPHSHLPPNLLPFPPPQPHFTDHLTGALHSWPARADGRTATCVEVAARAMAQCPLIAQALVFCMRSSQRLLPARLPLQLYAAVHPPPAAASAAQLLRVRCCQVAFTAFKMTNSVISPRPDGRRRWLDSIIARVYCGHCNRVQVNMESHGLIEPV